MSFDTLCQRPLPCLGPGAAGAEEPAPPTPPRRTHQRAAGEPGKKGEEEDGALASSLEQARSHPARLKHKWLAMSCVDCHGVSRSGAAGRLLAALTRNDSCLARAFCQVGDQQLLNDGVAEGFVRLLEASGDTCAVMFPLIRAEVDTASTFQMLFRRNTGLTRYLSAYFRVMGRRYVQAVLGPTVELVFNSAPIEINGDKAPELSEQRIALNTFELIHICQGLQDMIIQNFARFPVALRVVVARICEEVERRFPGQGYNVVSSLIFLRFLCPSMLAPQKYGLIDRQPDYGRLRTLILVSKLLQSLANGACQDMDLRTSPNDECGTFIRENTAPMREFVNLLVQPVPEPVPGPAPDALVPSPVALWTCAVCSRVHRRAIPACRGCHTPAGAPRVETPPIAVGQAEAAPQRRRGSSGRRASGGQGGGRRSSKDKGQGKGRGQAPPRGRGRGRGAPGPAAAPARAAATPPPSPARSTTTAASDDEGMGLSSLLEQAAADVAPALSACLRPILQIPEAVTEVSETLSFSSRDRLLAASADFRETDARSDHARLSFDQFEQALLGNRLQVLERLLEHVNPSETSAGARAAVAIAMSRGCALELVKRFLHARLAAVASVNELFASESMCTRMLDVYVKLALGPTLRLIFRGLIQRVVARIGKPPPAGPPPSDPGAARRRHPSPSLPGSHNASPSTPTGAGAGSGVDSEGEGEGAEFDPLVLELLRDCLNQYFPDPPPCPASFRCLLSLIRALVDERFPGEGDATMRWFIGYSIKRALEEPAAHGIAPVLPDAATAHTLDLFADLLSCLISAEDPLAAPYRQLFAEYRAQTDACIDAVLAQPILTGVVAQAEFRHLQERKQRWDGLRLKCLTTLRGLLISSFDRLLPIFSASDCSTEAIQFSFRPVDQLVVVLDSIVPSKLGPPAQDIEETLVVNTPPCSLTSSAASSMFKFGSLDSGIVLPPGRDA